MVRKTRNPGAGRRQGFAIEVVSDANLNCEYSPITLQSQQDYPVAWIVRRVPVSTAAARVYAELNRFGGAHA